MNITIDDDVPLPEPDKPGTWVTGPKAVYSPSDKWQGPITEVGVRPIHSTDPELDAALAKDAAYIEALGGDPGLTLDDCDPPECPCCGQAFFFTRCTGCGYEERETGQRYPAETTYDAKGVPTTDCYLVGGPLNGRNGPIVGTAAVVELEVYAADGSVASVELYELGDRKDLGCRYWKGTKP